MKSKKQTKKKSTSTIRAKRLAVLEKLSSPVPLEIAAAIHASMAKMTGAARPTSVVDLVRREVGHKTFQQTTLKLGTFCTGDMARSKDSTARLDAMVKKANHLVGRKIIRVTVDPTDDFDPLNLVFDINLHFD